LIVSAGAFLGNKMPLNLNGLAISTGVTLFFLFIGIHTFRKMEKSFADLI